MKMSEAQYEFIKGIASILNIRDEKIIKKGLELISLLTLKPQLNCSATCKGVVCLDIASSFTPNPIPKEDAIKYSGCKKKIYINVYNNISKLLNLDKIYSVKEICLLTNICDVQEPAMKLFDKFKNECDKIHYDFDHPMYGCAAVWAVSRKNKIKLNVPKLVEISRVKKSELDELTKKVEQFLDVSNKSKDLKDVKSPPKSKKNLEGLPSPAANSDEIIRKRKVKSGIMTDEEYMEWKRRMLE